MPTSSGSTKATILLSVVVGVFAATIVLLVVSAFSPREAPTFEMTDLVPVDRTFERVLDTVTVDATDERAWTFFDFERRSTVTPPDTASWDIAVRRFDMIAAVGALDMNVLPFDSVVAVPRSGFVATTWAPDTVNPALDRWYSYSFATHLLVPKGNVFVVRTAEAGTVKLQVLSYYCSGMVAGCVTFRYQYAPPGEATFTVSNEDAR